MMIGLEPPQGLKKEEKTPPKLIFNNPRSSIKPESAPDPNGNSELGGGCGLI